VRHPLAESVRHAVDVWAEGQALECDIIKPEQPSDTVSVVLTNGCDPGALKYNMVRS
jgi:hypothetical protein